MSLANQMRVFLVLYAATGMFVSYMMGYALMDHDLQKVRIDLATAEGEVEVERARVQELVKRAGDRDRIELELRECLKARRHDLNAIEDVKWQMGIVIKTCPGRVRWPELPRP